MLPAGYYPSAMPVVTVKMPKAMHARLETEATRRRTSKSAVLRDSFAAQSSPRPGALWERIQHLAGSIDGPGNLSALSKKLPEYGRSRSR